MENTNSTSAKIPPSYNDLCSKDLLQQAWQHIRDKGSAGGIDKQSVAEFALQADTYLAEILAELQKESYVPEPYLAIHIPKTSQGFRGLGLPTVRDKIVQHALRILIEPHFEKLFIRNSFGYRPEKGTLRAIQSVQFLIEKQKNTFVLQCDIDRYFDNIPHKSLIKRIQKVVPDEKILHLIRMWIKMARIGADLNWKTAEKGVPQGSILSPLLSNLFLNDFDWFVVRKGWGYVRYADDFIILTRSRQTAEKAMQQVETYLKSNLGLILNAEKKLLPVEEGFEFLGMKMIGAEVTITPEKKQKLFHTVKNEFQLTPTGELHLNLLASLRSISGYYGKLIPQHILEEIDAQSLTQLTECLQEAIAQKKLEANRLDAKYLAQIHFASQKFKNEKQTHLATIIKQATKRKTSVLPPPKQEPKLSPQEAFTQEKIEEKKKEYQQKAAEARELLITQPGYYLGKAKGKVIVRKDKKILKEIPFAQLDNITIQSWGTSFSSDLIYECAKQKINIHLLEFGGDPFAYIMYKSGLSASAGLAQLNAYQNGKAESFAKEIVEGKMRNQITVVKYFEKSAGINTEHADKLLTQMYKCLNEQQDIADCPLDTLRGKLMAVEGRCAAAYWEYVRFLLEKEVPFPGRLRQGAEDPVNAALNYGYGILYGRVFEAVARAKLHPSLSALHAPSDTGVPTLTFDLIEEFRPQAVDRAIFTMIRKEHIPKIEEGKLTEESRGKIAMKVLERLGRYEKFRGQSLRLHDIIMAQAKNYAKFLTGEEKNYSPYLGKW